MGLLLARLTVCRFNNVPAVAYKLNASKQLRVNKKNNPVACSAIDALGSIKCGNMDEKNKMALGLLKVIMSPANKLV